MSLNYNLYLQKSEAERYVERHDTCNMLATELSRVNVLIMFYSPLNSGGHIIFPQNRKKRHFLYQNIILNGDQSNINYVRADI